MKKKFLTLCLTLALSTQVLAFTALPVHAASTSDVAVTVSDSDDSDEGITLYSDVLGWRTKEVNGKTYRRLYNYTRHEWVGDWILIG
jgi:hypothetical protein